MELMLVQLRLVVERIVGTDFFGILVDDLLVEGFGLGVVPFLFVEFSLQIEDIIIEFMLGIDIAEDG